MTVEIEQGPRAVRVAGLAVGDGPVAVLGGLAGASRLDGPLAARPDARWIRLPARPGRAPAAMAIARLRTEWDGPLFAEPGTCADLAALAGLADGLAVAVTDACQECGASLARQAVGRELPILLRRGTAGLDEWLAQAARHAAGDDGRVILCEGADRPAPPGPAAADGAPHNGPHNGHRDGHRDGRRDADGEGRAAPASPVLDLALLRAARERSGLPVVAYLGHDAGLAPAAIAAGADGLLLAPAASTRTVARAREAATVVAPLVRAERPATIPDAREAIDRVDAALATLLERRAELAGTVQRLKPVGGFAGRDMDRERRLVAAMARRAPRLGAARLAPIMNAVIEAGLHLAEEDGLAGARVPAQAAHPERPGQGTS